MPYGGHMIFYTNAPIESPRQTFREMIGLCQPEYFSGVATLTSRWWPALQAIREGEPIDQDNMPEDQDDLLTYTRDPTLEDIEELLSPAICVSAGGNSRIGRTLYEEASRLPVEIIGEYRPGRTKIEIGPQHLFEVVDMGRRPLTPDRIHYYGHATAALRFSGYKFPRDWDAARELLLNMPTSQRIMASLQEIWGDVTSCVYWDR